MLRKNENNDLREQMLEAGKELDDLRWNLVMGFEDLGKDDLSDARPLQDLQKHCVKQIRSCVYSLKVKGASVTSPGASTPQEELKKLRNSTDSKIGQLDAENNDLRKQMLEAGEKLVTETHTSLVNGERKTIVTITKYDKDGKMIEKVIKDGPPPAAAAEH